MEKTSLLLLAGRWGISASHPQWVNQTVSCCLPTHYALQLDRQPAGLYRLQVGTGTNALRQTVRVP